MTDTSPYAVSASSTAATVTVKFGLLAKVIGAIFATLVTALLAGALYYISEMSQRITALSQKLDDHQKTILAMEGRFGSLQQGLTASLASLSKEMSASRGDTMKAIYGVERAVDAAVGKIEITNTKLEATNAKLDGVVNRLWPTTR